MKKRISSSVILVILAFFLLPQILPAQHVTGDGNVTKKSRKVDNFNAVSVSSGVDLYLTQGNAVSLEVEADQNLHEYIITEVEDGVLKIYVDGSIRSVKEMNVYLTFREIDAITASGGSDVEATGTINQDRLTVECSGGSDINMYLKVNELKFSASGGSDANITGEARVLIAKSSGGSDLDAMELKTAECTLESSGGSDAHVYVTDKLKVQASGGSDVYYKGDALVDASVSGSSDLHKK